MSPKKYTYSGEKMAGIIPAVILLLILIGASLLHFVGGIVVGCIYLMYFIFALIKKNTLIKSANSIDNYDFSRLDVAVDTLCSFFDIDRPELYIIESDCIEVFAVGFKAPYALVISDCALRCLDDDELIFALGQELSHIKRKKVMLLSLIAPSGTSVFGINLLFGIWQNKVEFTSDRVGLIVSGNIKAAVRAMLKTDFVEDDIERKDFYRWAEEICNSKKSALNKLKDTLDLEPYTIEKIINIIKYSRSRDYKHIVDDLPEIKFNLDKQKDIIEALAKEQSREELVKIYIEGQNNEQNNVEAVSQENNIEENKEIDYNNESFQNDLNSNMAFDISQPENEVAAAVDNLNGSHDEETSIKNNQTDSEIEDVEKVNKNLERDFSIDVDDEMDKQEEVSHKDTEASHSQKFNEDKKNQEENIMAHRSLLYNDQDDDDEFEDFDGDERKSGKKLVLILCLVALILSSAMFAVKVFVVDKKGEPSTGNKIDINNIDGKNDGQPVDGKEQKTDEEMVKGLIEEYTLAIGEYFNSGDSKALNLLSSTGNIKEVVDKEKLKSTNLKYDKIEITEIKINVDEAYIKAHEVLQRNEVQESRDVIYKVVKEENKWLISERMRDNNTSDSLDDIFDFDYSNSTFNADLPYEYKDVNISQRLQGEEALKLRQSVIDFNNAWLEYINNGDRSVFNYAENGSEVYNSSISFNKNGLKERFLKMLIKDVRKGNDAYYVWTHEKIEEIRNGDSKIEECHWIYKIKKIDDKFYLSEYLLDPTYSN